MHERNRLCLAGIFFVYEVSRPVPDLYDSLAGYESCSDQGAVNKT